MTIDFDPSEERLRFFDRPGREVAPDMAAHWMSDENRKEIFPGNAAIIGLETPTGMQYFNIEEVILYGHESTMKRWGNTRGPEIAALEPGQWICYNFRGRILTFAKTQGAENLMLSTLREVDRLGDPLPGSDKILTSSKIATLAGLYHRAQGLVTPFSYRGRRAMLLSVGGHIVSEEELQRLENELLNFPD